MRLAGVSSSNTPTSRPIHSSRTHWSRRDRCAIKARVRRVSRLGRNAVSITIKNTHAWTIVAAELADEFGVSRERVRQIDVSSFVKVRKTVKSRGDVMEEVRADGSVTMGMSHGNR